MKERGRFIVFEGIDGAGKTTQIELLAKHLREQGRQVYCTAEPTESVSGGLLRDALAGVTRRTICEMAAMFVFDRIHHKSTAGHQRLFIRQRHVVTGSHRRQSGSQTHHTHHGVEHHIRLR